MDKKKDAPVLHRTKLLVPDKIIVGEKSVEHIFTIPDPKDLTFVRGTVDPQVKK